jgi:hypothetical protein
MTDLDMFAAGAATDGGWSSRYGPEDQAGALNEITLR